MNERDDVTNSLPSSSNSSSLVCTHFNDAAVYSKHSVRLHFLSTDIKQNLKEKINIIIIIVVVVIITIIIMPLFHCSACN
jgi:hypothetical protein